MRFPCHDPGLAPVIRRVGFVGLGHVGAKLAGPLGTASVLKVVTNYLATAHLVALAEALVTAAGAGMDLATTYDAIRISSGNSFVHETEGQVILNGSRDIGFTLDLVAKDLGLFQAVADRAGVPLELSPLLGGLVADAMARYGPREWSPNIIRGLEEVTGSTSTLPASRPSWSTWSRPVTGTEVLTRGVGAHTNETRRV